jgi:uncharacterized membrane protein YccC
MSGEKREWKREMLAERETLRARVAKLEQQLSAEREAHEKARESQDRALRIGAEARDIAERLKHDLADEKAARSRAEADNAASRRIGQQMSNLCYNLAQSDSIPEQHRQTMRELAKAWDALGRHPGAALLEELRALRALAEVVRQYVGPIDTCRVGMGDLTASLAAADALRGRA